MYMSSDDPQREALVFLDLSTICKNGLNTYAESKG